MDEFQIQVKKEEKSEWENYLIPFRSQIAAETAAIFEINMKGKFAARVVNVRTQEVVYEI